MDPSTTPRSSPPSSPPQQEGRSTGEAEMTTRQKRSYEDMTSVARDVNAASHVAREPAGEHASQAESDYGDVPSSMTMPSASAHTMLPPQRPASAMLPPSQKPPISGQDHVREPVTEIFSSEDTVSDGDAQGHHSGDDIERHDNHDVSEYDEDPNPSEPQDKIGDFAWRDLEQRYHDKMQECRAKEDKAHAEFARLCDYFGIWANTISSREVDRSFKRLKTQMTYVRHEEYQLEQKRQHYIKVVDAFKSALQLLEGN